MAQIEQAYPPDAGEPESSDQYLARLRRERGREDLSYLCAPSHTGAPIDHELAELASEVVRQLQQRHKG